MPQAHKVKATIHKSCALWRAVKLQTYFTAFRRIDYFIVVENKDKVSGSRASTGSVLLVELEKELFRKLEGDFDAVKCDLEEQVTIVQDIEDLRSERVP